MSAQVHAVAGVRLPIDPFLAHYRHREDGYRRLTPTDETVLMVAQRQGDLDYWLADRLAVRVLGLHPAEVWGRAWSEADALLDLIADSQRASRKPVRLEARAEVARLRATYKPAA